MLPASRSLRLHFCFFSDGGNNMVKASCCWVTETAPLGAEVLLRDHQAAQAAEEEEEG